MKITKIKNLVKPVVHGCSAPDAVRPNRTSDWMGGTTGLRMFFTEDVGAYRGGTITSYPTYWSYVISNKSFHDTAVTPSLDYPMLRVFHWKKGH